MKNLPPAGDEMLESFVHLGWATRVMVANEEAGGSTLEIEWTQDGRENLGKIAALLREIQELYPFAPLEEKIKWLKTFAELIALRYPPEPPSESWPEPTPRRR